MRLLALLLAAFFFSFLNTSSAKITTKSKRSILRQDADESLRGICTESFNQFAYLLTRSPDLFRGWIDEVPRPTDLRNYFWMKPVTTPSRSVCHPMNTTCCRQSAEKHIARVAQRNYGSLFLNISLDKLKSCFVIGRFFYHAMGSIFSEVQRQLETHVRLELDNKLPINFFQEFFDYLSRFLITSELCDLSRHVETVTHKLFDFIYSTQGGNDLHSNCFLNVSTEIMAPFHEGLLTGLQRQLYNVDLIFRAFRLAESVAKKIQHHKFAPECLQPLTQVRYCAYCTGYYKFKPCLFFCLNVFRGCFADIADLYRDYQRMVNALSVVQLEILPTLQPATFIAGSLHYLVEQAKDLKQRNIQKEVELCKNPPDGIWQPIVHQRIEAIYHNTGFSSDAQNNDVLSDTFIKELQCVTKVGDLLNSIPEEMCYLNKKFTTIADTGNHRCWNGRALGSYTHPILAPNKASQAHNPVFFNKTLPFTEQFLELNIDISIVSAELNSTLEDVFCIDDEDCISLFPLVCSRDPNSDVDNVSVSGSGSASGSGSGEVDDTFVDMETDPTPDVSTSTPSLDDTTASPPDSVDISDWNGNVGADEKEYEVINIPGDGSGSDRPSNKTPEEDDEDYSGSGKGEKPSSSVTPEVMVDSTTVGLQQFSWGPILLACCLLLLAL